MVQAQHIQIMVDVQIAEIQQVVAVVRVGGNLRERRLPFVNAAVDLFYRILPVTPSGIFTVDARINHHILCDIEQIVVKGRKGHAEMAERIMAFLVEQ